MSYGEKSAHGSYSAESQGLIQPKKHRQMTQTRKMLWIDCESITRNRNGMDGRTSQYNSAVMNGEFQGVPISDLLWRDKKHRQMTKDFDNINTDRWLRQEMLWKISYTRNELNGRTPHYNSAVIYGGFKGSLNRSHMRPIKRPKTQTDD